MKAIRTVKNFYVLSCFFLTWLCGFLASAAAVESGGAVVSAARSKGGQKLVILGDSLTEGYGVAQTSAFPALIEKKIQLSGKKWQVINSGVGGSTTGSAPSRMKWILRAKPDLILLFLGANDGLRGIKVAESEKNLAAAIALAKQASVKLVLGGLYMPPNYGEDYRTKFEKMYVDLAKDQSVRLIPFILKDVAGESKLNLADGIHPNEEGHKIMAENVYAAIKDLL